MQKGDFVKTWLFLKEYTHFHDLGLPKTKKNHKIPEKNDAKTGPKNECKNDAQKEENGAQMDPKRVPKSMKNP